MQEEFIQEVLPEEIVNKLHTALYSVSPFAEDRERIISEMGETIWLEALAKIIDLLPDDKRSLVVAYLNSDELDKAVAAIETTDIDIESVLREVSTSVLNDVVSTADTVV